MEEENETLGLDGEQAEGNEPDEDEEHAPPPPASDDSDHFSGAEDAQTLSGHPENLPSVEVHQSNGGQSTPPPPPPPAKASPQDLDKKPQLEDGKHDGGDSELANSKTEISKKDKRRAREAAKKARQEQEANSGTQVNTFSPFRYVS